MLAAGLFAITMTSDIIYLQASRAELQNCVKAQPPLRTQQGLGRTIATERRLQDIRG